MDQGYGILHFLAQADAVGKATIAILLLMSAGSWYVILMKLIQNALEARATRRFMTAFRATSSVAELAAQDRITAIDEPFARLTADGISAAEHHRRHGAPRLPDTGPGELVSRALRQRVQLETARRESGLTFLAATASSAPFIGLFGTVWGIYQALVHIGMSGQGTLDKVAGPVGEALVMTAAGLAVAIPAVLAYNFFVRANRTLAGKLNAFSNELFTMLATGARIGEAAVVEALRPPRGAASVGRGV